MKCNTKYNIGDKIFFFDRGCRTINYQKIISIIINENSNKYETDHSRTVEEKYILGYDIKTAKENFIKHMPTLFDEEIKDLKRMGIEIEEN